MTRKTFNEKLNDSKDMPKIIRVIDEKSVKRYGGENMLIAPPLEYNEIMSKIPKGKVITITEITTANILAAESIAINLFLLFSLFELSETVSI